MGGSQRFGGAHQAGGCPRLEAKSPDYNPIESLCREFHAIVRIDEVEKEGVGRISTPKGGDSGNVRQFPTIVPSGGDTTRE